LSTLRSRITTWDPPEDALRGGDCTIGPRSGRPITFVPSQQPQRVRVASEAALALDSDSASILFGIGPARGQGPDPARIERLQRALAPRLTAARWARQIHGTELAVVSGAAPDSVECVGEADALATGEPGLGLLVWTADCVPVALVGPRAVAMVHAGWRGSAGGVVPAAVAALQRDFHTRPADLCALLGPSISGPHYQVGPEVIDALGDTGIDDARWRAGDRVDLRAFLTAQLEALAVADVQPVGPCTFTTPEFASFRRDGAAAGRQWSLVYQSKTENAPARQL
jgi:YfiH family protein